MIFNQTGGGGSPELQTKTVGPSTSQQLIVPDTGFDGLSQVTVTPALLETKSVTPSTNQQVITPSSGYYGMGQVTVSGARLQSRTVTPSSSYQNITPASGYYGLSNVGVSAINLQYKNARPSTNQDIIVEPDTGYQGLARVTVYSSPATGYVLTSTTTVDDNGACIVEILNLYGSNFKINTANISIFPPRGGIHSSSTTLDGLFIGQDPGSSVCTGVVLDTDGDYYFRQDIRLNTNGYPGGNVDTLSIYQEYNKWYLRIYIFNPEFHGNTEYIASGFIEVSSL